jgi:hypothetical protein
MKWNGILRIILNKSSMWCWYRVPVSNSTFWLLSVKNGDKMSVFWTPHPQDKNLKSATFETGNISLNLAENFDSMTTCCTRPTNRKLTAKFCAVLGNSTILSLNYLRISASTGFHIVPLNASMADLLLPCQRGGGFCHF